MARRVLPLLHITSEEHETLQRWVRRPKTAQALALRARVILTCADGLSNKEVSQRTGMHNATVGKWRQRFIDQRLDGLLDEPRPGAPRKIDDAEIEKIVRLTLETVPKGATHWSTRDLAKRVNASRESVRRTWKAFRLQPHREGTFKVSADPLLIDKIRDVVGLYLNPPERALVLCVDEKSQIQALDRTQAILPMQPGRMRLRTHDYRRHGTTSLFAALDVASGQVMGMCASRHRSREFLAFLKKIDRDTPQELDLHLVVDNYATHKTPSVRRWLEQHPRFHLHFTPTGASWLNQIERWFASLTDKALRRSVHRCVRDLVATIDEFIEIHNGEARPFRWSKTADEILLSIARHCAKTTTSYLSGTSVSGH